ncbi:MULTISPECIES: hypothetical protein [Streptomyces]|uniref:Uncharacterized protein n=1 Tax=Streptomyces venezuelae TaxID=54571 RepID=A0A5P2B869_STRVZ|nr:MULTISPECIES: hypothetical protein [Streptomyces]NEA02451.1 hypothetical protein [Streptomyces sp. SID10116]MYY80055.1 hypothetical protein [Streptomyces sp. SID335]MYZ17942.1 hypothetical protein [Streptomyces sp. SID337]NDZ90821.1 hypothetical protein [Streptomyces sp. SID10115]NEB45563.1 hypothetical protein [Streptomyces sp. SID339]
MTVIPKDVVLHRRATAPEAAESMESLRGDCARMAPHWRVPVAASAAPVPPSLIHGVTVPPSSARLIGEMSEYGD